MKKFKTAVAMKVPTQEQYEQDLKEPLKELGYESEEYWNKNNNPNRNYNYLITYGSDCNFYNFHNHQGSENIFIDHYNPELFLALAAQTKGVDPIIGEYMICVQDSDCNDKQNDLIKVTSINNDNLRGKGDFNSGYDFRLLPQSDSRRTNFSTI